MASLPQVGGDAGNWGTKLNDFLLTGHNSDGTHKDVINVRDFGAVGNGIADDTNALKLALASGKPLVLTTGTYRLTSEIILPTNCRIYGVERPSFSNASDVVFYIDHPGNGFVIDNSATGEQIYLSGFMITKAGSTYADTGIGIKVYTSTTINGTGRQFNNIKITRFNTGIYLAACIMDNFEKIFILDCNTYGIHLYGASDVTGPHDCSFRDIFIYGTKIGVLFDGFNQMHSFNHIKIFACSVFPISTTILTDWSFRITFRDLMFELNSVAGSTSFINILGGINWLFESVWAGEDIPLFSVTTDTNNSSISVKNVILSGSTSKSSIGNGSKILLENVLPLQKTLISESWSNGTNINQKYEDGSIQSPYVSGGSVYGQSIITPAFQAGVAKSQYITTAGQDINNVYWTKTHCAITTAQPSPYADSNDVNAFKMVSDGNDCYVNGTPSYGSSPAGKTFVFQVWAKPVSANDGSLTVSLIHTASLLKVHTFHLNRDEWTLCYVTIAPTDATPTTFQLYLGFSSANVNGVYLYEPCLFLSDVPNAFQKYGDSITIGDPFIRKFGVYEIHP